MLHADFLPHDPGPQDLVKAALRSRSGTLREVLARRASGGQSSFPQLVRSVTSGPFDAITDPEWGAALARVVALQNLEPDDLRRAFALFRAVFSASSVPHNDLLGTWARVLLATGEHELLGGLLTSQAKDIADDDTLHLALADPTSGSPWADPDLWSQRVTTVLEARGLALTTAEKGTGVPPFDTVRAGEAPPGTRGGRLVSVVMTTYRPGPTLLQSLRSITAQTWGDLEILLVDDCSGPDHEDVLAEAAGLDDRVRLIRLEHNSGTYGARNAALAVASGEFVTGQDDDDWAHPRRVEMQLEPLLADARRPATWSHAVWASEDLQIAPLGWPAVGKYAPSYLVRRELVDRAGRYLPARKAADTELIRRVEAMTGGETLLLPQALSLYRTRPGSLSRDDFTPGWDHPARVTFWQQSARVHDRIRRGETDATAALTDIAVPSRFLSPPEGRPRYDLVLVADYRTPPGPGGECAYAEEVAALAGEHLRVAVLQLDDVRATGRRTGPVDPRLLDLVNDRTVDRVHLDDEVDARLVVVRSVGLLQYAPTGRSTIRAERVLAVADEPPRSTRSTGAYDLHHCAHEARTLFGRSMAVMGVDEVLRQQARAVVADSADDPVEVVHEVYLGACRTDGSSAPERAHGARVLGALVSWPGSLPADTRVLQQVLPAAHAGDIRVRGRRRDLEALDPTAGRWQVVGPQEQSTREFLTEVDVLAYFPDRGDPGPELSAAFAAGCVVVTHPRFRVRLGDAAVYAWPSHAADTYARLAGDPAGFAGASARSVGRARSVLAPTALVQRLVSAGALGAGSDVPR